MKLLLLGFIPSTLFAQTLIVGIPSTDVAPKREFAIAHETQANRFQSGGYWNSFTFATYQPVAKVGIFRVPTQAASRIGSLSEKYLSV
jgi:hypothetical protein